MKHDPTAYVERRCPAKLNWFLEILRKRDDGFHEIQTVMQTIDWADTLRCWPVSDGSITLSTNVPGLPTDESNLVVKAALLLREKHGRPELGARMELDKQVPWGGGLGGGSSDAAGALDALNLLWGLGATRKDLMDLAAELGSDVSFFLSDPLALCEGRGEQVSAISGAERFWLVFVWPGVSVSTPQIYRSGKINLTEPRLTCYLNRSEDDTPSCRRTSFHLFNRLQQPCFDCFESVRRSFDDLTSLAGTRPCMLSGSGSSMFVVCEGKTDAQQVAQHLESRFSPPARVRITSTLTEREQSHWRST